LGRDAAQRILEEGSMTTILVTVLKTAEIDVNLKTARDFLMTTLGMQTWQFEKISNEELAETYVRYVSSNDLNLAFETEVVAVAGY
jgi:chorismate-pyruvate lyase